MRCGGKINLGVRGQYLMEQLASLLSLALRKRGKVLGADRKASGGRGRVWEGLIMREGAGTAESSAKDNELHKDHICVAMS